MTTTNRISLLVLFTALGANLASTAPVRTPATVFSRAAAPVESPLSPDAWDIPFVPNAGQFDPEVAFRAATFAGTAYVSRKGDLVYALPGWSLVEHFQGAAATPVGVATASPRVAFFSGSNKKSARADLATYRELSLGNVWPGVRVALRAEHQNIEKIFHVAPGASADAIRVSMRGATALTKGVGGSLVAQTGRGPVQFAAPFAFQDIDGERRAVPVSYRLQDKAYGFTVGRYDHTRPLVIDPVIQTTYLGTANGGAFPEEAVYDIKVHPTSGDVYAVGAVHSSGFPGTTGGVQPAYGGAPTEGFVARLSADLRTLIQATYLGGSATDGVYGLHLTATDVYVTGITASPNFPTTAGAAMTVDPTPSADSFVTRLPLTLTSLTASTVFSGLTGTDRTELFAVAVHPNGDVYACGNSFNGSLPATTGAAVSAFNGNAFNSSAIIVRMTPTLSSFVRTTYQSGGTFCTSMAFLPGTGEVVIAGRITSGGSLPNTTGSAFPSTGGTARGWVSKFSADLSSFPIASYAVGGGNTTSVRVHPVNGDIYVMSTGSDPTGSLFPPNSFSAAAQTTCGGAFSCAAVVRYNAGLTAVVGGTYYGNGSQTTGTSNIMRGWNHLLIDPVSGDVFIGLDAGRGMPNLGGGFQTSLPVGNLTPGVVVRISGDLTTIRRASYLSGQTNGVSTNIVALAIHPLNGDLYLAGRSQAADLPAISGGAQATHSGGDDGFITRVTADLLAGAATPGVLQFSAATYTSAESISAANISVTRTSGSSGAVSVQYAASAGTATAGQDFTAVNGTLNWANGDATPKSFSVPVADDSVVESTETVNLTLSGAGGGATLGSQTTSQLQITDNDVAPPTTPGIALSATTVSAPATVIGSTSAAQSVTVTSSGTASLVLGATSLGGANSADFAISANNCNNQTLAPNATCTLQVTFSPGAAGARNATLSIPSNAAGSPATVNLSGTGNSPPPPPPPVASGDRVPSGGGGAMDGALLGLLLLALLARSCSGRKGLQGLLLLPLAAIGTAAHAEWRVGVDLLQSDFSNAAGIGRLSAPASVRSVTDDSNTGIGLSIGYRFSQHFLLEGGYRDLGSTSIRDVLANGNPVTLDLKLRTKNSYVVAIGEWQWADRWFAQLRAGLAQSRTQLSASNGRREVRDSNDPLLGAAVGLSFADSWQVRLQYERIETGRFNSAAGFVQELESGRANVLSLGLQKRF